MNVTALALLFYPLFSRNREEKRICGRYFPNGASAVNNLLNVGYGFTVTRLATAGLFRIDFEKPFNQLLKCDLKVAHATADFSAVVTSIITNTAGAVTGVTFQVYTSAVSPTISDIPAAATSWISIDAAFIDSRVR